MVFQKLFHKMNGEYSKNILKLKPDYMVHGDDWLFGKDKYLRSDTIKALKKVGGKLIEIPHTKNISSHSLKRGCTLKLQLHQTDNLC